MANDLGIVAGGIADLGRNIAWLLDHADLQGAFLDVAAPMKWTAFTQKEVIAGAIGLAPSDFSRAQTGKRALSSAELERLFTYLRLDRHQPQSRASPVDRHVLRLAHEAFVTHMTEVGWGAANMNRWLEEIPARKGGIALIPEYGWQNDSQICSLLQIDRSQRDLLPRRRPSDDEDIPKFRPQDVVAVAMALRHRRRALLINMNARGQLRALPGADQNGYIVGHPGMGFVLLANEAFEVHEPLGRNLLIAVIFSPEAPRELYVRLVEIDASMAPIVPRELAQSLHDLLSLSPRPAWLTAYRYSYEVVP